MRCRQLITVELILSVCLRELGCNYAVHVHYYTDKRYFYQMKNIIHNLHTTWSTVSNLYNSFGLAQVLFAMLTKLVPLFMRLFGWSALKSVKCYPGGRKIGPHFINIWDIVTNVVPLHSVNQAPSYKPNLTLISAKLGSFEHAIYSASSAGHHRNK